MPGNAPSAHLHARNQSLDALRGLAATLVVITHAAENYAPVAQKQGSSTWLAQSALSIDIGRTGVVLFFLISGFAVAHSLRDTDGSVSGFVIRRFFRLFPMFWLSVAMAAWFFYSPPSLALATALANLSMVPELLGFKQMMGIYWTLETELVSYAMAVLLVLASSYNSMRVLGTLCAGLVMVFALMMFGVLPYARLLQWQMLPHNLAIILWGSLFHLAFSAPDAAAKVQLPSWLPSLHATTLLLGLLVLSPSCYALLHYAMQGGPDQLRWGVAYPVAFSMFLWAYFCIRQVPHWTIWLGQISYSSYLLHSFVVVWLSQLLTPNNQTHNSIDLQLFVALVLLVTTALASISFVAIEQPAMRMGKKLAQRYCQRRAGMPT